jgi:hypothetical protein
MRELQEGSQFRKGTLISVRSECCPERRRGLWSFRVRSSKARRVLGEGAPDSVEDHRSTADGAGNCVTGAEFFAHWSFMRSMVECSLDADQHIGERRSALQITSPDHTSGRC